MDPIRGTRYANQVYQHKHPEPKTMFREFSNMNLTQLYVSMGRYLLDINTIDENLEKLEKDLSIKQKVELAAEKNLDVKMLKYTKAIFDQKLSMFLKKLPAVPINKTSSVRVTEINSDMLFGISMEQLAEMEMDELLNCIKDLEIIADLKDRDPSALGKTQHKQAQEMISAAKKILEVRFESYKDMIANKVVAATESTPGVP